MARLDIVRYLPAIKQAGLLCCVSVLLACTSVQAPEDTYTESDTSYRVDALFPDRPALYSPVQIHTLNPDQVSDFLAYFTAYKRRSVDSHKRLAAYLQLILADFKFSTNTYTASETLSLGQGNCMSLAILTTSFADLAKVNLEYQLVEDTPVFMLEEDLVVKGVHIRTKLFKTQVDRRRNPFDVFQPGLTIDYFPNGRERFVSNLSEQGYLSRYYLNLAAAAIVLKEYGRAYWLSLEALKFNRFSGAAFNNLAIIYGRTGALAEAEVAYQFGITHAKSDRLTLLKNYQLLLGRVGRNSEAQKLNKEIAKLNDQSPVVWYYAGLQAFEGGHYKIAIIKFRRAIKLAPYFHEASFGLAKAYLKLDRLEDSRRALQAALANAEQRDDQSRYRAKLNALAPQFDS